MKPIFIDFIVLTQNESHESTITLLWINLNIIIRISPESSHLQRWSLVSLAAFEALMNGSHSVRRFLPEM